jgi:hypothetical protein
MKEMSELPVTRNEIVINGGGKGGLMMICMRCASPFRSKGYKVSAADAAADAHIETHSDPRIVL